MRLVMRLSSAALSGAVGFGLLVAPVVTPAWGAERPVTPKVRTVAVHIPRDAPNAPQAAAPVAGGVRSGASIQAFQGRGALVTSGEVKAKAQDVSTFSLVGATLPSKNIEAGDIEVRVRAKGSKGTWGDWQALTDEDSGPDTDSAEGRRAAKNNVTAPLWVGPSEALEVRVRLDAPEAAAAAGKDVQVTLVDPGTSPADDASQPVATADAAAAGRPTIIRRSQWGADESLTCSETSATSSVSAAVVHHTAGSNGYRTRAEAMRQLRADYAYHTKARGWCDLGYNFVVDKWGNIYEGRRGSMDSARVGAHAAGFNKMTVGVSMLGNYSSVAPSFATKRAVANVIAWKLSDSGRAPASSVNYIPGAGSPKYREGRQVTIPRVVGHRNVGYTSCPGNAGYSSLSWIRQRAASAAWSADFVRAAFRDTIGRQASEASVVEWQGQVAASGRDGAVIKLQAQNEARRGEVRSAYQMVLNRQPNSYELSTHASRMAKGVRREKIVVELMAGAEFFRQAGSTRTGFVNLAYARVLDRGPSTAERARWVRLTANGRTSVAQGIYRSWEGRSRMVDRYTQALLGRKASSAEIKSWASVAYSYGDAGAQRMVIKSSEYFRKAGERY